MSGNLLFWLHAPISLLLPALLSFYVGRRASCLLPAGRASFWLRLVVATVTGLFTSLALIFWGEQDRVPLDWLLGPGFFLLGYLLTAFPLLLFVDLLMAWSVVRRASRWLCATALLVPLGLTLLGRANVSEPASVAHLNLPVKGLDAPFEGYRVLQLSDIHLHGSADRFRLERLVEQANAQSPDLMALTGDVVDGPMDNLRRTVQALGRLKARDGVWLVLGNHEYYADAEACVAEFRRLGINVLLDEHRVLKRRGAQLVIAGVTNPQGGMHGSSLAQPGQLSQLTGDPRLAFASAPKGVRLLLAHQPKSVAQATGLDVSVALAGHTHGGQFLPWTHLVRLVSPYPTGLSRVGEMWIYVSPGLGTFGPRQRLGSPPEMTLFTLTR